MPDKPKKLKKQELNRRFIEGLGDHVLWSSGEDSAPLLVNVCSNTGVEYRLRAYLYNLTNPPGGRTADEYKAQIILPGQQKKERASLDYSDGRFPLLVAYAQEGKDGVFVLWDADKHDNIAFSSNIQVKSDAIIMALYRKIVRSSRTNNEIIVSARPQYLYEAIKERMNIMRQSILEVADGIK